MSSLYVRYFSRYCSRSGKASFELKSSNCRRQLAPKREAAALMNSPMMDVGP